MYLQNFIDRDAPDASRMPCDVKPRLRSVCGRRLRGEHVAQARRVGGRPEQPMRYFAQGDRTRPSDWPGPGIFFSPPQKDDAQWLFWLRWLD